MKDLRVKAIMLIALALCVVCALCACNSEHTHTAGEWIVDIEAECERNGVRHNECTGCGVTVKTESVPATGHSYKGGICTACGADDPEYVAPDAPDGDNQGGNTPGSEDKPEGCKHELVHHEEKAPTCTQIGWDAYDECSKCDYTTYTEKAALGHNEVVYPGYAATCTETGLADGVKCSRCEAVFTEREVIPALGHSVKAEVDENRKEATSTVDGSYDSVVYCSGCGMEMSRESKIIPAHSHVISATFDGSDMVYSCSVCNMVSNGSDGLEYTLNSDNTYTVKSIGNCTDECVFIPAYVDSKRVVAIGDRAFSESTAKYIGIAHTVKTIGTRAFYGCVGLTEMTIPSSVWSIGTQVFYKASNLSTVYYNGSYIGAEDNPFLNLSHINKVVFGSSNIPDYVCYNNSNLKEIVILDCVTSIGERAFSGCSNLNAVYITDIASWCNIRFDFRDANPLRYAKNLYLNGDLVTDLVIPDSVTSIADCAFQNYSKLTSVIIPDSVTSIGDYSFSNCSNLTSITIPDSVTGIGNYAFYDCSSLASVIIGNGVTSIGGYAFFGCSSLASITIPDSVISIGWYVFYNCKSLESVTIPDSVTSIDSSAFYGCSNLNLVYITDIASWCNTSFGGPYANPLYYAKNLYLNGELVTDLVIPDGVTSIGNYAFFGCSGLTSITIPDSVTSIGENAFEDCSSLTSITIGDNVTSISRSAFLGCSGLTSVTIPNSVTSIGYDAFSGCSNLNSVYITDIASWCNVSFADSYSNPLYYAKNLYLNGELVTDLVIPGSVTNIVDGAFRNCGSLTRVTILDNVTSIGSSAFSGCSSLTSITIPGSVTSIGDWAFYECSSLTSIIIPDSVTSIGEYAFRGCSSLTSAIIPNSVTSIGVCAFDGCSKLNSVTFKNTSGWWRSSNSTATSETSISARDLSNKSTAAKYLTDKYCDYYWTKT